MKTIAFLYVKFMCVLCMLEGASLFAYPIDSAWIIKNQAVIFMHPDSSKIHEIVYKEGKGFLAFDTAGAILFEIFSFDNGPDYPSEGYFRIVEDGKIGYADEMGNIRIKPQFKAALPFQNGMAAVCTSCSLIREGEHSIWEGGKWGFVDPNGLIAIPERYDRIIEGFDKGKAKVVYLDSVISINKKGNCIDMTPVKYTEWIDMLGSATTLMANLYFSDQIRVECNWEDNEKYIFSATTAMDYLRITIHTDEKEELIEYDIIPWQNFSIYNGNEFLVSTEELCTVTDYAVVYSHLKPREKKKNDMEIIQAFTPLFFRLLERDLNHQLEEETQEFPEHVQFISKNIYPYYVDLQIASPGTILPDDASWKKYWPGKMIYLQLVPDIGALKKRWIKSDELHTDTYYTSVEDDLLTCFSKALAETTETPERRNEIFQESLLKMRSLFSASNSYVNFLYEKYETRLHRWLELDETTKVEPAVEIPFGDYEPKLTPDQLIDYMPSLKEEIEKLPAAELPNTVALIRLLQFYQEQANTNPGHWEDGNMILGAHPKEYRPSKEELLASEIGDLLATIIHSHPKESITEILNMEGLTLSTLEYVQYTVTHVDVMGSGRFFYINQPETIKLKLTH